MLDALSLLTLRMTPSYLDEIDQCVDGECLKLKAIIDVTSLNVKLDVK